MSLDSQSERRIWPRLTLSTEQFKLSRTDGNPPKIFGVADVSVKGLALRIVDPEDLVLFSIGASVEGTLNLRRQKYPISARVRHVGKDLIGCEFVGMDHSVEKALLHMLDPKKIGEELKPIPTQDLNLWYHGTSGTEFMIFRAYDGTITKLSILVLGNLIQWQEEQGLMTGVVESSFLESEVLGVTRFETLLFKADEKLDRTKCEMAQALISSCPLPTDLKKWCLRHLGEGENHARA